MENTLDNQEDSPRNPDLLLRQIVDELAALKLASDKKNQTAKRQTRIYSVFMGLILGVCIFNIVQQNERLRKLESNQTKIKQTLQSIDSEIAQELQRLDDMMNGEIPMEIQESIIAEQVFLINSAEKIRRGFHDER